MKYCFWCRYFLVLLQILTEDVNAPLVGSGCSRAGFCSFLWSWAVLYGANLHQAHDCICASVSSSCCFNDVLSKHSLEQRPELAFPPPFAVQGLQHCTLPSWVNIPPCKLQENNLIRRNWATYPDYSNYQEVEIKGQVSLNKGRNLRQRFPIEGHSISHCAARDGRWETILKNSTHCPQNTWLRLGPAVTQLGNTLYLYTNTSYTALRGLKQSQHQH